MDFVLPAEFPQGPDGDLQIIADVLVHKNVGFLQVENIRTGSSDFPELMFHIAVVEVGEVVCFHRFVF